MRYQHFLKKFEKAVITLMICELVISGPEVFLYRAFLGGFLRNWFSQIYGKIPVRIFFGRVHTIRKKMKRSVILLALDPDINPFYSKNFEK